MSIQDYAIAGENIGIHNHYQLKVSELEKQRPDVMLSVLKFSGYEAISQPWKYTIEVTSPTADIPAELLINTSALFLFYPDGGPWQTVKPRVLRGMVTAFQQCGSSADETRYVVTLEPRLALLNNSLTYAVYQHKSVIGTAEDILKRHQFSSLDYRYQLNTQYPPRDFYISWDESDLTFIQRHLARVGVFYYFAYDEENRRDVMVLGDSSYAWVTGPAIPFRHPAGLFDGGLESVWDMSVKRQSMPKQVRMNDEYYRDAQADMQALVQTNPEQESLRGEVYRYGERYEEQGKEYREEPEQGRWFAKRRQERLITEQTIFEGQSNCMDLRPGMIITTPGKNWSDAPDGMLITSVESKDIGRSTAYTVRFTAIPHDPMKPYRPALWPRPEIAGTVLARVTSPVENAQYAELDEVGRYHVQFQFDLNTTWKKGFESLPVRLAKPYAGDMHGWHFPLIPGSQVMIAFTNGDPDRPYILCAMHDSRHEDHVTLYNYQRNVLKTPANNKIRLEDRRGYEHVKISTEYGGKSQISLGHIVDAKRNKRGEGFELRSDSFGAVRAGKGLFLSADAQQTAAGNVLDMSPAISLIKGAVSQMNDWQTITQSHHNLQPDVSPLKTFAAGADQLKSPAMLLSAPKGIAAVSPETVLLKSGTSLHLQSTGETQLASGQRLAINASQAISLLSQQEGVRVVSGKGPLTVESHGDTMGLTALKDVTVQSVQGMLQLTAKNGITLACGGAYIRLSPGGEIEIHGPSKMSLKGAHAWEAPASQDFPLPELPQSVCKDCLKKAQEEAMGFVPRG